MIPDNHSPFSWRPIIMNLIYVSFLLTVSISLVLSNRELSHLKKSISRSSTPNSFSIPDINTNYEYLIELSEDTTRLEHCVKEAFDNGNWKYCTLLAAKAEKNVSPESRLQISAYGIFAQYKLNPTAQGGVDFTNNIQMWYDYIYKIRSEPIFHGQSDGPPRQLENIFPLVSGAQKDFVKNTIKKLNEIR